MCIVKQQSLIITATEITQTGCFYKYTCSDQSINLCILRDACYELFCVFGDFYDRDTWCRGSKITALQSLILNVHHLSIVIAWTSSDCLRFQGVVSQLSSLFFWLWQLCIRVCYGTSEITCEWQNHIFLSNKINMSCKHYIKPY